MVGPNHSLPSSASYEEGCGLGRLYWPEGNVTSRGRSNLVKWWPRVKLTYLGPGGRVP